MAGFKAEGVAAEGGAGQGLGLAATQIEYFPDVVLLPGPSQSPGAEEVLLDLVLLLLPSCAEHSFFLPKEEFWGFSVHEGFGRSVGLGCLEARKGTKKRER